MTRCDFAACGQPATAVVSGWSVCRRHNEPDRIERPERPMHAYPTLRLWFRRLHGAGLNDPTIAGLIGVSPSTIRAHRRALDLPVNRSDKQIARDHRVLTEQDQLISRCTDCARWQWDGHCTRCARREVAA